MKKLLFLFALIVFSLSNYAQTRVVRSVGDTIAVNITQTNKDGIKYSYKVQGQVFKNQLAPTEILSVETDNKVFVSFDEYLEKILANRTEEYCLILATSKFLSSQVTITIDFGQETGLLTQYKDRAVYDEASGKLKSFNSVIDALNWMNSQGWEFINAYAITVGNQNVYHYVMKRDI